MHSFKRLMVGLELIPADASTIRYTAKITRMMKPENVCFIHVSPCLDIPPSVAEAFPDLAEPVDETIEAQMREMVAQHFTDAHPGMTVGFEVSEGCVMPGLLRRARQKLIDLIIIGRKRGDRHEVFPQKVARKSPCSVLLVPEGSPAQISRILVPFDFSEHSRDALEVARVLAATAREKPPIRCLHVYDVPSGYYKTGKSREEFAEIMRHHAEQNWQDFLGELEVDETAPEPLFVQHSDVTAAVAEVIREEDADLVIIGARGRTAASAVFLGSNSEKLMLLSDDPMVVVRHKGERMGLFDALLEI